MSRRWSCLLLVAACLLPGVRASAEPVMSVFPNTRFTGEVGAFEVVLQGADTGRDLALTLTPRDGLPGQPLTTALVPQSGGTRFGAALPLVVEGTETPAAPGLYDAAVSADGDVVESCAACVTLVTRAAPTSDGPAASSVRRVQAGRDVELTVAGRAFADGTVVEALLAGRPDPGVSLSGATAFGKGADTSARVTRAVRVLESAPLGLRDLRFTNTDGRTSTCRGCLTVTSPLASVEPVGATNGEAQRRLVLRSSGVLPRAARPVLLWDGPQGPSHERDVLGKALPQTTPGVLEALFDLTGAAPGDHAYRAGFRLPDGSTHDCEGQCRFTVRQVEDLVVEKMGSGVQQPGTTRSLPVWGSGFSRGTEVEIEGLRVTTDYRSPTQVIATVTVPRDAEQGPRSVLITSTDGRSAAWDGEFLVQGEVAGAGTTAPVPVDGDPELDPEPDLAPAPPSLRLPTRTSLAQQRVTVTGTAEPGSALDLFAYTRPSTSYKIVRSLNVPEDGRWTATVAPSAGTRLYARSRNASGRSSGEPVVLEVRPVLVLTALRTGPRSARFSVRAVPARKGLRVTLTAPVGGRQVPLGAVLLDAQGRGVLDRRVTGPLVVTARTTRDVVHAAGTSAPVRLR